MNFLFVIGAAKAGTTSLVRWLARHPAIRMGQFKEPAYFTDFRERRWSGPMAETWLTRIPASLEAYLDGFGTSGPDIRTAAGPGTARVSRPDTGFPAASDTWAIDGSVDYLWNDAALDRLAEFAAERRCRFVCLVRDPVDRALSEYNMTLRMGIEPLSCAEALRAEPRRRAENWHPVFYHLRRSHVQADLARFRRRFGDDLLVMDFADLAAPQNAVDRVCAFLGLAPHAVDDAPIHNASPRTINVAAQFVDRRRQAIAPVLRRLPKPARRAGRRLISAVGARRPTTTERDVALLRDLLADEIAACLGDPTIPTGNWRLATQAREAPELSLQEG